VGWSRGHNLFVPFVHHSEVHKFVRSVTVLRAQTAILPQCGDSGPKYHLLFLEIVNLTAS
jgi:hypothetical protein